VAEPEPSGAISTVGGRIEKLYVKVTGETISRGQPVALIYSPKFSLPARNTSSHSKISNVWRPAGKRRRSQMPTSWCVPADDGLGWGLNAEQIDEIASAPERPIQMTIYSAISGIVTKRNVTEGQYVKEGDVLLT
jgi:Cu(I)/Ag(I) efflux system membrane fusion protein